MNHCYLGGLYMVLWFVLLVVSMDIPNTMGHKHALANLYSVVLGRELRANCETHFNY